MILFIIDPKKIIHSQLDNKIFEELDVVFAHTLEGLSRININQDDIVFIDTDNSEFNGKETLDSFPSGTKVITLSENKYNIPWIGNPINKNVLYLNIFGVPYKSGEFIDEDSDIKKVVERPSGSEKILPQEQILTKIELEKEIDPLKLGLNDQSGSIPELLIKNDPKEVIEIKEETKVVDEIIEVEPETIIKKDPPESVTNPSIAKSMFEVITDNIREGNKLVKSLKEDQGKYITDYVTLSHDSCSERLPNNIDIDESLRHMHVGFKTKGSKTYSAISKRYGIRLESIDLINQTRFLDYAEELLLEKELHPGDRSYRFNTSLNKKDLMKGVEIKLDQLNSEKELLAADPIQEEEPLVKEETIIEEIKEDQEIKPKIKEIKPIIEDIVSIDEIAPVIEAKKDQEIVIEKIKDVDSHTESKKEKVIKEKNKPSSSINKENSNKNETDKSKKQIIKSEIKHLSYSELEKLVGQSPVIRVIDKPKTEKVELVDIPKEVVHPEIKEVEQEVKSDQQTPKKKKNKNKNKKKNKNKNKDNEAITDIKTDDDSLEDLLSIMSESKSATEEANSEFISLEEINNDKENTKEDELSEFTPLEEIEAIETAEVVGETRNSELEGFIVLEGLDTDSDIVVKEEIEEPLIEEVIEVKEKTPFKPFNPEEVDLSELDSVTFTEIQDKGDEDLSEGVITFTDQSEGTINILEDKSEEESNFGTITFIDDSESGTVSIKNSDPVGSSDMGQITFNEVKENDEGSIKLEDISINETDSGSITFIDESNNLDKIGSVEIPEFTEIKEETKSESGMITFTDITEEKPEITFNEVVGVVEPKELEVDIDKFSNGLDELTDISKEKDVIVKADPIEEPKVDSSMSMFTRMSNGAIGPDNKEVKKEPEKEVNSMMELLQELN